MDYERYEEQDVRKFRSKKKNTKKWCKGIVGREHVGAYRVQNAGSSWHYTIIACANCGKHLSYRWRQWNA